ncbi:MAG: hypothetical protein ACRD19_03835, partial [Terriglobia bacterium]
MMSRRVLSAVFALGALVPFTGCGMGGLGPQPGNGTSGTTPNPTSVLFVSAPPASMAVNASATIYAAAIYARTVGSGSTAVSYSLSCSSPNACGGFSDSDEGGAVVYTAPAAIPVGGTVTVTAASVADPSITVSGVVTIVPPIPISVSIYGSVPASIEVGASVPLSAVIQNDVSANPQIKWTVSCGSSSCGSFSALNTTSTGRTTYTAPVAIPTGNTVT